MGTVVKLLKRAVAACTPASEYALAKRMRVAPATFTVLRQRGTAGFSMIERLCEITGDDPLKIWAEKKREDRSKVAACLLAGLMLGALLPHDVSAFDNTANSVHSRPVIQIVSFWRSCRKTLGNGLNYLGKRLAAGYLGFRLACQIGHRFRMA
jgi:hypothetical protein